LPGRPPGEAGARLIQLVAGSGLGAPHPNPIPAHDSLTPLGRTRGEQRGHGRAPAVHGCRANERGRRGQRRRRHAGIGAAAALAALGCQQQREEQTQDARAARGRRGPPVVPGQRPAQACEHGTVASRAAESVGQAGAGEGAAHACAHARRATGPARAGRAPAAMHAFAPIVARCARARARPQDAHAQSSSSDSA